MIKTYYNDTYKIFYVIKNNIMYLRLHYNYKVLNLNNYKFYNQRVDSFKMFNKIEKLTYRLKLPSFIKIHFIILITQFESIKNDDLYRHNQNINPNPKIKENDIIISKIETLLKKQIFKKIMQYLIK